MCFHHLFVARLIQRSSRVATSSRWRVVLYRRLFILIGVVLCSATTAACPLFLTDLVLTFECGYVEGSVL